MGGAERLLVKLAQNISRESYDIKIVCLHRKGVWVQELDKIGIEVVSMNKKEGFDPGILFRLTSYIKHEKPDIVNTHLWTADLWGRLASLLAGVKHIIVTEQNVDIWKRWYHKAIDRFLFKWTEYVICVSDQVVKFYNEELGVSLEKIRMIPNAIDISLFDARLAGDNLREIFGLGDSDFLFVCAARLHPQKSHHTLIEAAKILISKGHKEFHVLLVGEGQLRGELEKLVTVKGITKHVHFLGIRQDIPNIFSQSDAFVLSSTYEGLPLAVLEAMAASLPVVATDVGGVSQIIINEKNGLLVSPGDPDALAEAMLKVMNDREASMRMGGVGRSIIEKDYDIKTITKKTVELFNMCISKDT